MNGVGNISVAKMTLSNKCMLYWNGTIESSPVLSFSCSVGHEFLTPWASEESFVEAASEFSQSPTGLDWELSIIDIGYYID